MPQETEHGLIQFEGFVLDQANWTLLHGETPVPLPRKTFDLLLYLARHPDRVVTKEELLSSLWPNSFVEESNLSQHVFMLRKALGRFSDEKIIATIPGRGYRLAVAITALEQPPIALQTQTQTSSITRITLSEEIEETDALGLPELPAPPARRRWLWPGVAALLLILAVGLCWWIWRQDHVAGRPIDVVLAEFTNATGDSLLDHSLNDVLRVDLRQSPFLSVLSPSLIQSTLREMQRPLDTPLSPTIAREVCERNQRQVFLSGSANRFGRRYVVTLQATACATGDLVAEGKQEVTQEEEIPAAIDVLAARMRRQLGESRASIRRFDKPLFSKNTGSLAALKAYSDGERLVFAGRLAEAIPLLKQAVTLDPRFAAAYLDLSNAYVGTGDVSSGRAYLLKAYALRDSATEFDKLYIGAAYSDLITGDIEESIRNYKAWAELYPRSLIPWMQLANAYIELGRPKEAIDPARRALALNNRVQGVYYALAEPQLFAGDFTGARATCEAAINKGLDGQYIRTLMLQIAFATHDDDGIRQQIDWGRQHPGSNLILRDEASLAFIHGQMEKGRQILESVASSLDHDGMTPLGDTYRAEIIKPFTETGLVPQARTLLAAYKPGEDSIDPVIAMAELGETERVAHELASRRTNGTLWKNVEEPAVTAAGLLAQHQPAKAVEALKPALPYDGVSYDLAYQRGTAFLAVHQWSAAETEFRKFDHGTLRPLDILSHVYPLMILGEARALSGEGRRPEAIAAYQRVLRIWSQADPGLPVVTAARQELASLQAPSR